MKSKVLVGGCFDILHIGHLDFLEAAKAAGDILIVLVESDQKIATLKGHHRPINSQADRARLLRALKMVNQVILLPSNMTDSDYDKLISEIKPDILATTSPDPGLHHKQRIAKLVKAKLKIVNKLIKGYSTGQLIEKLR